MICIVLGLYTGLQVKLLESFCIHIGEKSQSLTVLVLWLNSLSVTFRCSTSGEGEATQKQIAVVLSLFQNTSASANECLLLSSFRNWQKSAFALGKVKILPRYRYLQPNAKKKYRVKLLRTMQNLIGV